MQPPRGFMLTFRTYGTWLHGDQRGSVDREHSAYGAPWLQPNARLEAYERSQLRCPPCLLDQSMRSVVEAAFRDKCEFRGWELRAYAARSNHAHVVVMFADVAPERMAQELKARATRALRERGLVSEQQPVWADHPGSRRYLWRDEDVSAAIAYVLEGQDTPR